MRIREGTLLIVKDSAPSVVLLSLMDNLKVAAGDVFKVVTASSYRDDGSDVLISLGLCSEKKRPKLHSLGGKTEDGHGWNIHGTLSTLNICFYIANEYIIKDDFTFKAQNLKGESCKILATYPQKERREKNVIIELNKDVGGNSCDGLGKKGHCILVPITILTENLRKKEACGSTKQK